MPRRSDVCALAAARPQDAGTRVEYDHDGRITSTASAPRAVGTTVVLKDLFKTLPVRHKVRWCALGQRATVADTRTPLQDFLRNVKREFGKLLAAMQSYALICLGVRLIVTHTAGRAPRATVVHTQGGGTMRDNIVTVLGAASANALQPFGALLLGTCTAAGFVSSPAAGSGRSSSDRQYFYVNGRPVDLPRVAKTLNEVYRTFNAAQFPAAVLDFRLPTDAYDVNVTPDKRRVMLHAEDELLSALHDALTAAYEPSRGTLAVGQAALAGGKSGIKAKRGDGRARQDKEADWVSDSKETDEDEEGGDGADSEPEHSLGSDASGSAGRRAPKRLRPGRMRGEGADASGTAMVDGLPAAVDGAPAPPAAAAAVQQAPHTAAKQAKPAGEQTLMHRFVTTPALERASGERAAAMDEDVGMRASAPAPARRAAATVTPAAEVIDVDGDEAPLFRKPTGVAPAAVHPDDAGMPLASEQHRVPETPAVLTFDLAALRVRAPAALAQRCVSPSLC
jgi:DNA mismatch repair ATPase MutL